MNNLSVLADPKIRENLLLAEAVAWLHDMGKCDERLLQQSALDYDESNSANESIEEYKYKEAHSDRVGTGYLELPGLGDPVPLRQLIEESLPRYVDPKRKRPW